MLFCNALLTLPSLNFECTLANTEVTAESASSQPDIHTNLFNLLHSPVHTAAQLFARFLVNL